ncbi:MAG: methyltransferase domain-containing protein [Planctomycetes bacterium]|nr:methyltransferase domain-containing protein [Planctomycetota bacterium]
MLKVNLDYFRKLLAKPLLSLIKEQVRGSRIILDAGSGRLSSIRGINKDTDLCLVGIEFYKPYILKSRAKSIHNAYVQGDIRRMPFRAKSFDSVVSVEVLEHLNKQDGLMMIGEMERVSKDKIVLTTPNGLLLLPPGPEDNPDEKHISGWGVNELKNLGFAVYGLGGCKVFHPHHRYKNSVGEFMLRITLPIIRHLPYIAFQLFCVKDLKKQDSGLTLFNKHDLTKHLAGQGIEIGALDKPLEVNRQQCRVRYVDYQDEETLKSYNKAVSGRKIRQPDIVGNAQDLHMLADNSVDFVIFSHVLEHLPNPLKALKEFHRVLKPGGILYLGIPDKRFTFDVERPVTPLAHVIEDFRKGAKETDDISHYEEWFRLVELKRPAPARIELAELVEKKYTIHFHVWVAESILALLNYAGHKLGATFTLVDHYYRQGDADLVFILRKTTAPADKLPDRLAENYSPTRALLWKLREKIRQLKGG